MLNLFRNALKSKIGAAIGLIVLVVIALAFASGDIAGMRSSGGASGQAVATVGDETVDANLLAQGAKRALDRVKQQRPTATMKLLVAEGGLEQVLDELIGRFAMFEFGKRHGIRVGDRLVDSEITQIPAFQGVDGKFDQNAFRQALAQQGIGEQALRDELRRGLITQQVASSTGFGATMPEFAARKYAALLDESRAGAVIALPSLLFAPDRQPKDEELAAYYKAHTAQFIRPERRVIRYAVFNEDVLKALPAPTDAEIAAKYKAEEQKYAARDERRITQLIAPTEAAAKAIVAEVNGGKSLEAAATEKGLSAAKLEYFKKDALAAQTSPEVAAAVFATPVGKLAEPRKSALGWHVIRVDDEVKTPAKSLDEVKAQIAAEVAAEKKRKAYSDLVAKVDSQFSDGANLAEVAKSIGVEVKTTEPLTADGQVYLKPGQTAPAEISSLLKTAFDMEQEQPQVAQIGQGAEFSADRPFAIFDVSQITPSAPAPLQEIKDDVKIAWAVDVGSKAAKTAALKIQAALRKGQTVEQAMAATGKKLPPVQQVSMSRRDLSAALNSGRQVPPPVSLMFHMAKDTVKVQSAAQDRGWFVVTLKEIKPGSVESDDLVHSARRELGSQLGNAYAMALSKAAEAEVGVKRHPEAIKALGDQLAGTGTAN